MRKSTPSLKSRKLSVEERAVIRAMDVAEEDVLSTLHYCDIVDLTPKRLEMLAPKPIPAGQRLEIAVSLSEGRDSCSLSGVVRRVMPCCVRKKYLLDIDVVNDELAGNWQRRFH